MKRSREGRKSIFPLAIIGVIGILAVILMLNRNPSARESYTLLEPTGIIGEKSSSSSVASSSVAAANHHSEKMSVSVAYQHSFGLFDDITDLMWQRMQKKTKAYSWYRNPLTPLEKVEDAEWWNSHNMLPHFQCPHAERIGGSSKKHLNEYEGTKLVCNPQRLLHPPEKPTCLIYSVGCAGDFKFEDAMAELHNGACEIHVFDPADWTKRAGNQRKLNNIHFHAWGLKSSYDQESKSVVWPRGRGGGFKTFQETLELLGHQNRIIDIFKIDCEGCEWSSHKDWIGFGFRQILIEMHGVPKPEGDPKARWYQRPLDISKDYYQDFLDQGYALFSRDPNGALGLELSFLKLHPDFWQAPQ